MLFKKKCPSCGAKNPKNAVTCAKCGALTELRQAFDKEIQELNEAIHLNPQDNDAYNRRGVAYFCLEQYDRAIADCSKSIELNPNYHSPYGNRAWACKVQGRKAEAIADWEKYSTLTDDPILIEMAKQEIKELSG